MAEDALAALPDALLSCCLSLLCAADRAAAACACARFARVLRHAPAWRHLSWAAHARSGATWVSDAALRGGAAAARAAGGALSLDLTGCRGFTFAALLAACALNGATLRSVRLAAPPDVCAYEACTGCSPPGAAQLGGGGGGAPAGLDAAQIAELAAALPACETLEADLCMYIATDTWLAAHAAEADSPLASLAPLARLPSLRLRAVRVDGAAGAPTPLCEADAAALAAVLRAARAQQDAPLRELTLQALRLPVPSLNALADALEPKSDERTLERLALQRCALDEGAAHSGAPAAAARLLRACGRVTRAAADDCAPGDAWAQAVGAALESSDFAPAQLSLRALRAGDAAAAAALGRGLVAAAAARLRHLTLCCSDARREGAAALADALAQTSALSLLDTTPALGSGRSSLALRLPPALHAAREAASHARARIDLRGLGDAATAAMLAVSSRGASARRVGNQELLLGSSALACRAAAALVARLAPQPAVAASALMSLHILRSRFDTSQLRAICAVCGRLRQLTLVTQCRLSGGAADAAAALTMPSADNSDCDAAAWTHMTSFRLHCLAFDDAEEAAGAWRAVLAAPPPRLATLQLSSDVPCGALLALRRAPRGGALMQLRLLRGADDFTLDPMSGSVQ